MSNFWNEPSYGRSRHDDSSLSDLDLLTHPATPDALSFRQLVDDARRAVLALPVDAQESFLQVLLHEVQNRPNVPAAHQESRAPAPQGMEAPLAEQGLTAARGELRSDQQPTLVRNHLSMCFPGSQFLGGRNVDVILTEMTFPSRVDAANYASDLGGRLATRHECFIFQEALVEAIGRLKHSFPDPNLLRALFLLREHPTYHVDGCCGPGPTDGANRDTNGDYRNCQAVIVRDLPLNAQPALPHTKPTTQVASDRQQRQTLVFPGSKFFDNPNVEIHLTEQSFYRQSDAAECAALLGGRLASQDEYARFADTIRRPNVLQVGAEAIARMELNARPIICNSGPVAVPDETALALNTGGQSVPYKALIICGVPPATQPTVTEAAVPQATQEVSPAERAKPQTRFRFVNRD